MFDYELCDVYGNQPPPHSQIVDPVLHLGMIELDESPFNGGFALGCEPPDKQASALVHAASKRLMSQVPVITTELLSELNAFFPELADRRHLSGHLERSVKDNLSSIFSMLEHDIDAGAWGPPPSALYWPRHMARQGYPRGLMSRIYSVGHAMIWHRWLHYAIVGSVEGSSTATKIDLAEALKYAHRQLFVYLDRAGQEVERQFTDEQNRTARESSTLRSQTVRDLLAGREPRHAAMAKLAYDINQPHVAYVCWLDPDATGGPNALDALAADIASTLGPHGRRLVVEREPHEVWGWCHVATDLTDYNLPHLKQLVTSHSPPAHVAIGQVAHGLEGFRRSHKDAKRVQELNVATHRRAPTATVYPDVALVTLLLENRVAAREYATRCLRDLAESSEDMKLLRDTVQVFLNFRRSYARTAEVLTVHRNTVLYRIQKAEKLLGTRLEESALEVRDALLIVDWLRHNP